MEGMFSRIEIGLVEQIVAHKSLLTKIVFFFFLFVILAIEPQGLEHAGQEPSH
jgi:branched-subunit amino acid ABC-type transport system permease component